LNVSHSCVIFPLAIQFVMSWRMHRSGMWWLVAREGEFEEDGTYYKQIIALMLRPWNDFKPGGFVTSEQH